jgi:hypothetical protein
LFFQTFHNDIDQIVHGDGHIDLADIGKIVFCQNNIRFLLDRHQNFRDVQVPGALGGKRTGRVDLPGFFSEVPGGNAGYQFTNFLLFHPGHIGELFLIRVFITDPFPG